MRTSKEHDRKYRLKHGDRIRASARLRYEENKEEERARSRRRHRETRIHHPEVIKKWYESFKNTPKGRMKGYKNNARTRGIPFDLTLEQFMEFWKKPCFYCGQDIKFIGIDRINSRKGYGKGNLRPCCMWCNRMKGNRTVGEFLVHCIKVVANTYFRDFITNVEAVDKRAVARRGDGR